MKILQVSPIAFPLSKNMGYAGIERGILSLDREFTRKGHDSIVSAAKGSQTYGRFLEGPEAVWKRNGQGGFHTAEPNGVLEDYHEKVLEFAAKEKVDVIHVHGDAFLASDAYKKFRAEIPVVYTLHNGTESTFAKVGFQRIKELIKEGRPIYFNAISKSHQRLFNESEAFHHSSIGVGDVIYRGVDTERFKPSDDDPDSNPNKSLFSLGRICRNKGQDTAIKVADAVGRKIIIGGGVHTTDSDFYEQQVKPHLTNGKVDYVGELTDRTKIPFFQAASAFLMPIRWDEPFGLVMIEALACGTPVVAFNRGSVPEVVINGKSGFVINTTDNEEGDLEKMVRAVKKIDQIDRDLCRQRVLDNFTVQREAEQYLSLYCGVPFY